MVGHIRVGHAYDVLKRCVLPRYYQILQIYRATELIVPIKHIHGRDIVVLPRLLHKLTHSLTDRKVVVYDDIVRCHSASSLVILIRENHPDVVA